MGENLKVLSRYCCCCSVAQLCLTPCDPMDCSMPDFLTCPSLSPRVCSNSCPLSRWWHPTISSSVTHFSYSQYFPASGFFPVRQIFLSGSQSIGASASASISPSTEYAGLISFRIDWFDLLAVQGTLKRILQDYNLKASILWCSTFFMVHLSHLYMTTGKTIVLTIWTFVGKVISLLFDMLSRMVIAFLLRINHLLISWLQSPSALILEPKKIKFVTISLNFSSVCHEVMANSGPSSQGYGFPSGHVWMWELDCEEGFLFSPCYSLDLSFRWVYLSFSRLLFPSLLFSAICKASSDNHFAGFHFFFLEMVLITASCTMLWTFICISSDTLFHQI